MGPAEINVEEGDQVTLRLTSDHPLEIHLHSYNLEVEVLSGEETVLSFEEITGGPRLKTLAHLVALRLFGDRRKALRSQLPMLALMVLYTIFSLWILSEPISVEEEVAPAENAQPDQTLREPPISDAPKRGRIKVLSVGRATPGYLGSSR
jgi:hypothetical protein